MNLHTILPVLTDRCPHFPTAEILTEAIFAQLQQDYDTETIYGDLVEVVWDEEWGAIGRWRIDEDGVDYVIYCYEIVDKDEMESYDADNLPVDWYVDWNHTLHTNAFD